MTNNKIPLALGYDPSTGNASGLEEFTLDLSNVGGVCDTPPTPNQSLVFDGSNWCPSTIVTGGGGGGGSVNLGYNAATTSGEVTNSGGTNATIPAADGTNAGLILASEKTKLGNIEDDATRDQSASEIRTLVESATDSNVFTDDDHSKLNGITAGATPTNTTNVTNAGALMISGGTITGNLAIEGTLKSLDVDKNSLVITNSASAVSSLSGASGSIVYFEGTTPLAPSLKTFAQILSNENYNISPGATYAASPTLQHITGNPIASTASTSKTALNTVSLPADTLASATTVRITYNGTVNGNGGAVYFYFDREPGGDGEVLLLESNSTFDDAATDQAFTMIVEIIGVTTDRQRITQNFKSSTPTAAAAGVGGIGSVGKSGFAYVGTTLDDSSAHSITLSSKLASSSNGLVSIDEVLVEKIGPLA